jgi:hypothetical protein
MNPYLKPQAAPVGDGIQAGSSFAKEEANKSDTPGLFRQFGARVN